MDKPVSLSDARKQREKERYAALVLKTFNDFEHEDRREFLERRAEVERSGRERI